MALKNRIHSFLIIFLIIISGCTRTGKSEPGILKVGFDIDDTVLFSYGIFANLPADKANPIDFGWVNTRDRDLSLPITPTIELVQFFRAHGHAVYFITARRGDNGEVLAEYLTELLGFEVVKDQNLFFEPKERIGNFRYTTKHRRLRQLEIDLYYGDSDSDIIAALKADVNPVRVVRHPLSIYQYGKNYFGDATDGESAAAPYSFDDLKRFYATGTGPFGETIFPITWDGPDVPNPLD